MNFFFFFWRNTRQNVRNKRIEPKHDIKTSICTKNYIYKNQQDTCIHSKIEAQSRILDPTTPFSVFSLNLPKQHKVRAQTSKFPLSLRPTISFLAYFFSNLKPILTLSVTHTHFTLYPILLTFSVQPIHTQLDGFRRTSCQPWILHAC